MFRDRADAGWRLAQLLEHHRHEDAVVIGLPRGGVVVAAVVADTLEAPLDILVVRKLGAPGHEELGIGAVVDGGTPRVVIDRELVERLGVPEEYLRDEIERQVEEIRRREAAYRGGGAPVPIAGRTAIVVDDGVATGASTRVALRALRMSDPARLVLAVPVGAPETVEALRQEADEVVAVVAPPGFRAVGQFYEDFAQTTDQEVIELLERARGREKGRVGR